MAKRAHRAGGSSSVADEICLVDGASDAARGSPLPPARSEPRRRPPPRRRAETRSSTSAPTRSSTTATPTSSPPAARSGWTARAIISPPTRSIWNRKTGRGPRQGQCRPAHAGRRQAGRRQCPADRHAARRHRSTICWSCSKAAAASPPRAARGHGDVTTLENAIYSPCPVTTETGCPKRPSWAITAARVIDDPAHAARPLRGRPAAAVRREPAAAADLQHRRGDRRARRGLLVPGHQPFDPQRASSSPCPITGRSARTAT